MRNKIELNFKHIEVEKVHSLFCICISLVKQALYCPLCLITAVYEWFTYSLWVLI